MSMKIEVIVDGHQIDDIVIEQLTMALDTLNASDFPEDKEYIAAFEKVIDWHGG